MPDPLVRLDATRLSAAPGGQVRVVVTIRNMGQIVEGFRVEVLGDHVSQWASVHPDEVPVYPQQEGTAIVVITVPEGVGGASGNLPFGVMVRSVVDPDSSAVVEGDLDVAQIFGLQPSLSPVTSRGRWRGHHELRISNWGNAPAHLRLSATDPDERLGFLVSPTVLDVPLGATATARIKARIRQPTLRGVPTRLPFQVVADPGPPGIAAPAAPGTANSRVTVDGAVTQVPILSRIVVTLATVAVVAAVAGIALLLHQGGSKPASSIGGGAPDAPSPTAKALDGEHIDLSWKPGRSIDSYHILTINPDSGATMADLQLSGQQNEKVMDQLQPQTTYCFQVLAVSQGVTSPRSKKVCAKTGQPSGTPTTGSPTTSGGGGAGGAANPPGGPTATQWIVMLREYPAGQPGASGSADAEIAALNTGGVTAKKLLSSAYPNWSPIALQPSWVVYLGPYPSQQAANAAATPQTCPKPATPGAPNYDCIAALPGAATG